MIIFVVEVVPNTRLEDPNVKFVFPISTRPVVKVRLPFTWAALENTIPPGLLTVRLGNIKGMEVLPPKVCFAVPLRITVLDGTTVPKKSVLVELFVTFPLRVNVPDKSIEPVVSFCKFPLGPPIVR